MFTKDKNLKALAAITALGSLFLAFQNCSRVGFGGETLVSSQSISQSGFIKDVSENEIIVKGNGSGGKNNSDNQGSGDVVASDDGKSCKDGKGKGNGRSSPDDSIESEVEVEHLAGMVECEMLSSKNKIVLSDSLSLGSNALNTRICMSENACLKILNDFAAARECSFVQTKDLTTAQRQCTRIFPGSKGTCKNAKIISDQQIEALLAKQAGASK